MCIFDFIYNYASLWSIELGIQWWLPYYIINPLSNMVILPSGSISGKRWAYISPGWVSTHRCLSLHPSLESSCSFMVVPLLMITYQGNSQSEGSWQCLNSSQGWVPHIYWRVIFPPIFIWMCVYCIHWGHFDNILSKNTLRILLSFQVLNSILESEGNLNHTELFFILTFSVWRFAIPGTTSPCAHCVTVHAATGSWCLPVEQLGQATCLTTQPLSFSRSSWLSGVPCY